MEKELNIGNWTSDEQNCSAELERAIAYQELTKALKKKEASENKSN
ncbi:MAG: hypothetical protein HY764_04410 [Candidatus Portnoybacteria bacterium]|nr:hypothetical protein [Candidatus Portnoybacteria bacterium]